VGDAHHCAQMSGHQLAVGNSDPSAAAMMPKRARGLAARAGGRVVRQV
jgi:hypothetical protein